MILEAFSVGMPVIATRWNALPELVDSSCGILVDVDSVDDLRRAILAMHLDKDNWNRMRSGALARVERYDPEIWAKQLHQWVVEVVGGST